MYYRFLSAVLVALFATIISPTVIIGQSIDSLQYLLDNDLVKDDSAKYEMLGMIIRGTPDVESRLQYCDQAIELAEKLNIVPAQLYVYKGRDYLNLGKLASALECFMKAAECYKALDSDNRLAMTYLYIAETYNQQKNHTNAKRYLKDAIEIYEEDRDSINLAIALLNLGYTNYSMGQYDTALILSSSTSNMFQKLDENAYYAYSIGNSGLIYSKLSDFDKAEDHLLRAIATLTKEGDERAVTEYMIEYAVVLHHKGQINKAISCATRGLDKAIENGYKEYERDAAQTLARLYENSGMYDSAYFYLSLYIRANDSINSVANIQRMADLRTDFEVAKKQAEVNVLEKNKMIQLIVIVSLVLILLLAMGLVILYYSSLKRSQKFTADLDERHILLEKQSTELKEQNDKIIRSNEELKQLYEITNNQKDEIISSILYAQRIQSAVLPQEAYITELLNENFILYKPKDIVSGDFYWIKLVKNYIIVASADCTGHGVPAAFMSMLGISLLNEIVQRREITQANHVLNELRKQIKHSLRQTGKKEESRDGIDIALCVIDSEKNIMQYAGANNPLYLISNNEGEPVLKEFKADPMPVGVHFSGDKSFTNHEIQLEIGDIFYIFSDGYADQIGGENNGRFTTANFKKLLLEIHDLPMYEQKEMLEQTLKEWMGIHPQIDDILVIGARV